MNYFSMAVIALFVCAGILELKQNNPAKAVFYWLSAAININIFFLR